MPYACKICIAKNGLKGSEIASLPQTEEELADHLEREHHMPVIRAGETDEQALERFLAKYPEARTCPDCRAAGAIWVEPLTTK